jgi:hypothetical protein
MYLKSFIFVIAFMSMQSVASPQLTFSKDTVKFDQAFVRDTLFIKNLTDSNISIDTIHYTWRINGNRQTYEIGMAFDSINPASGKSAWFAYSIQQVTKTSDTSFRICIADTVHYGGKRIGINPRKSLALIDFEFGSCILCAGISKAQSGSGNVSIKMVFVNNKRGRDTVTFTGPVSALVTTGVLKNNAGNSRALPKEPPRKENFMASGRKIANQERLRNGKMNPAGGHVIKYSKAGKDRENGF